jgi:hypothetical protein
LYAVESVAGKHKMRHSDRGSRRGKGGAMAFAKFIRIPVKKLYSVF